MATSSFVICNFNGLHENKLSKSQRFDPLSSTSTTIISSLSLPPSTASGRCFPASQRFLTSGRESFQHGKRLKMEFIVNSGDQVGDVLPFGIQLPGSWPAWIPGILVGIIGTFFTNKWGPFGKFKEELDKVEVVVDKVADQVEAVAEKVEDFVGDVADDLPENSTMRKNLERIEKVADTIGDNAQMVSDMIDKMDELEEKVEDLIETVENNNTSTKTEENKKAKPQVNNL